ncbi:MAG: PqqD family protein [Ignavibacteria bacterium]|nr:PqqD family protein [Ignavibacteria bacterium]
MNLFWKKNKEYVNFLDLTPIKEYEHEFLDGGFINILIPKFKSRFMVENIMPRLKSPYIKAKLDEFGSAVWLLIDGYRNVDEISQKLIEKFGDRIQPVHERTTRFLSLLHSHKMIKFK